MRHFIADHYAAVWRPDGRCELYLRNITVVDRLRTHDLTRIGLPGDTMRALWREAHKIVTRGELTGIHELTESPFLLWIDGRTGAVLDRWEAMDPWSHIVERLREANHAA
ncbi:MAG TPA: hypothetical protein VNJ04_03535 [Gemmatimonadaceae bacterium]|nr:hypothetical protein [Gemmatimonadaceae bacterium]